MIYNAKYHSTIDYRFYSIEDKTPYFFPNQTMTKATKLSE